MTLDARRTRGVVAPTLMLGCVLFVLLTWTLPPAILAQTPDAPATAEAPGAATTPELAQAGALYDRGLEHVELGRWADALAAFQRSYALSGVPAALFNAATALRALGRYVEARDALAELLDQGDLDPAARGAAEVMLAEASARVATLRVSELPEPPDVRLRLDGVLVRDTGERPLEIETDEGTHTLVVLAPEMQPFEWNDTVAGGETREVEVRLEAEGDNTLFWVVIGVSAAVVAAVIVTAVILSSSAQLQPRDRDDVVVLRPR